MIPARKQKMISKPGFVLDLAEDVVYHGSVPKLKKTMRCTYVVSYYNAVSESANDAVDKTVTRWTLVVDTLFGDLVQWYECV